MVAPVDIETVAAYVGAPATDPVFIGVFYAAVNSVNRYLGPRGLQRVPQETYDQAIKTVTAEAMLRKRSPGGVYQWAAEVGAQPLRLSRDPLIAVRDDLAPYRQVGRPG